MNLWLEELDFDPAIVDVYSEVHYMADGPTRTPSVLSKPGDDSSSANVHCT